MVKELGSRFSEVERRVRALVAENEGLRARVRELEAERNMLGEAARDSDALRANKSQVQDRLKRLLRLLETVEVREEEREGPEGSPAREKHADGDQV
jgi:predicted nuclease with TOPRIM domain